MKRLFIVFPREPKGESMLMYFQHTSNCLIIKGLPTWDLFRNKKGFAFEELGTMLLSKMIDVWGVIGYLKPKIASVFSTTWSLLKIYICWCSTYLTKGLLCFLSFWMLWSSPNSSSGPSKGVSPCFGYDEDKWPTEK